MTVNARFDGRVFVPDGPVDLPVGHRVRVVAEPAAAPGLDGAAPEVRDFCATHDLAVPVSQLVQLAREEMSGVTGFDLRVERDWDSDESWLVVTARLVPYGPSLRAEHASALRRWIGITEPQARDRVCFTFAVA